MAERTEPDPAPSSGEAQASLTALLADSIARAGDPHRSGDDRLATARPSAAVARAARRRRPAGGRGR